MIQNHSHFINQKQHIYIVCQHIYGSGCMQSRTYKTSLTPTYNPYIQRQNYINQSKIQIQSPKPIVYSKNLIIDTINEPSVSATVNNKRKYSEHAEAYSPSSSSTLSCDNMATDGDSMRLKKNAREKQRRNEMKENFDELCSVLETNPRSEKYTIITEATTQVKEYKKKLAEALSKIEELNSKQ